MDFFQSIGQKIKDSLFCFSDFLHASPQLIFLMLILALFVFFLGFITALFVIKKSSKSERKDAVNRSRAVLSGQMLEQVAPFLPDFPCNPADVRFVGKPIDFIAFPGAVSNKPISEILFIEVKSGNSVLSEREKEIKLAVEKGKVRYVEYRI